MSKDLDDVEPREPSDGDGMDDFLKGDSNGGDDEDGRDENSGNSDSEELSVDPDQPGVVEYADGSYARRMTVYFPIEVAQKIRILCAIQNREMSDVVNEAMDEYLEGMNLPDIGDLDVD